MNNSGNSQSTVAGHLMVDGGSMHDRIVDVCGDKTRASAQFNYKEHWISFSCIFNTTVAVFKHIDGDVIHETCSVEKAIEFVDKRIEGMYVR